jgi:hypothetical protein
MIEMYNFFLVFKSAMKVKKPTIDFLNIFLGSCV